MDELHQQAREAFKNWVITGKSRHGPECEIKKKAVARFKYAVRYIKRNELTLRANALARGMQQNDVNDFWKEVKIMNHSKIPLPSSMEGVSGSVNIVELWRRHYMELFNCFKSDVVTAGDVSHDNVVIRPDDISHAIGKLALNKSCGLDLISAEHLKFSCHRVPVLLALCFTAMLTHGILPDSTL